MKIKLLYILFPTALGAALFFGNASGPGTVQNVDRTGSPLSPATCGTIGCHNSGTFSPTLRAELLKDGQRVDAYEPGEDYTLKLTTSATGTPSVYGFQTVALLPDNANAGSFEDIPTGFRSLVLNNRTYVEHTSPRASNTLEVKWEAPAAGAGAVRFYAAGIAANGNGSSSGDGTAALTTPLTITEATTSSVFGVETLAANIRAFPNPVGDQLNLNIEVQESGRYFLSVLNLAGQEIQREAILLQAGTNLEQLQVRDLAAGHYFVRLSDGKRIVTQKILKK